MGTYTFSPRGSRKNKATHKSDGHISFGARLKRRALLVVVAVLSISSLVSLVTPATSYAATISSETNIATQALTYTTYFSLLNCLTDSQQEADTIPFLGPRIKETSIKSGDWWSKNISVPTGEIPGQNFTPRTGGSYLNKATVQSSGFTWCNDVVKTAVKLFGFSGDYMAMLCSFVSYRANSSNCQTSDGGTGDFGDIGIAANQARYRDKMSAHIWPNGIPTLTQNFADKNAALYLYYRDAFLGGCSINGNLVTPPPAGTKDQFIYKNIRIIKDDGSSSTADYVGVDRSTNLVIYQDVGKGGGNNNTDDTARISASCGDIADKKLQAGGTLSNAFKDYKTNHPTDTGGAVVPGGQQGGGGTPDKSCAVNGIGWIICPVVTFVSGLADQMFTWVSDNFLQTNISFLSTTGSNTGTYIAWGIIRNIANVAFVVVFLIIIFSQLTGVGVANYGIKKMLPRLVIAAILVNISFFVCQLAVDLSNILGYGIKAVFDSIGANVTSQSASILPADTSGKGGGDLWGSLAFGVLVGAGAAAGYAALGSLIAVLLAAVVAIAMIFLILIMRQALIILLIVMAPLAFVAFLLPNTEALFNQWRKLFTTLLLLFPIVGLIFGASALASAVLEATYGGSDNTIGQIIAAGTLVIPLFAVPFVLKKSLDGVGQLGSIVGNLGNRAGKAAGQAGQKGFEESAMGRGRALRKQGRENFRTQKFAENVQKGGLRSLLARGPGITAAQRYANRALDRSAFSATEKANAEEAAAAEATITKQLNLTSAERQSLALGNQVVRNGSVIADGKKDAVLRRAAIKIQANGSHDDVRALVNSGMQGADAQTLAASLGAAPNKPTWAGQGVLEAIAQGRDPRAPGQTGDISDYHIAKAVEDNAYSSEKIATGDKDELAAVHKVVTGTSLVSRAAKARLGSNSRAIAADPTLRAKVGKNAEAVGYLNGIR